MWLTKPQMIVLEIPKCGSTSLHRVAEQCYGKRYIKHHGHKTLRQIAEEVSPKLGEQGMIEAVGVVRKPSERFISQITNYMKIKKNKSLEDALHACIEQSHIIFKPQSEFVYIVGVPYSIKLTLYPIENMHLAQGHIIGQKQREISAHYNESAKYLTIEDILKKPIGLEAMDKFQADVYLYNAVSASGSLTIEHKSSPK